MVKLRRYVLSHLSILFFSIFLPLFAIASVIFLIKLATYTAVIQLSIMEMGKLYLFVVPELLFYTLPIAFFVAGALALYRLSNDNEMVVIFSLGISPRFIARVLAFPALFLSLLMLINFILVIPYIKVISGNFLEKKKAEAKFNLSASEFGHHFGDWMLFINKSDPNSRIFEDVVLFNKEMKEEIVIRSDKAEMINKNGVLQLKLDKGESYSYDDTLLRTMLFETSYINDKLSTDPTVFRNTVDFWTNSSEREKKDRLLITNSLLSMFPILSVFMIIALGVVHARHQKRWIYLWLFLSIVGYYSAAIMIQKSFGFHAIWIVSAVWIVITYSFYKRLVGNRF